MDTFDNDALEKLKQIPIFTDIRDDYECMTRLLNITRRKHFPSDQEVIREGNIGSEMYIVLSGSVEIRKRTRAGDNYTVVKLDAAQNVFFGELALVDDDRRSATVKTLLECDFLVIRKDDFLQLGNEHPNITLPITRSIAKILAGRLRKTTVDMLTIFDALVHELSE